MADRVLWVEVQLISAYWRHEPSRYQAWLFGSRCVQLATGVGTSEAEAITAAWRALREGG